MKPSTVQFLLDLNLRFYTDFGASFAATRRRIQPGVRRVLNDLPDAPGDSWLDLGCGSGALAMEWLRAGRESAYLGLDFSPVLLEEARQSAALLPGHERLAFAQADLALPGWSQDLTGLFAGMLSFAVLHHLPSAAMRERVLRQAGDLLRPGGQFIHSVWQFQHAPRLLARRVDWAQVGLREEDLEPGDTLLDWRAAGSDQNGLRYVHLFDQDELAGLARAASFQIMETFESDGQGGKLGLYQVWIKQ